MKNNNFVLKVDLSNATDANSVYEAFAKAKFNNHLMETERKIIADIAIREFLDYVDSKEAECNEDCDNCPTINIVIEEKKKPNFFKRLWRRLFKKSSR